MPPIYKNGREAKNGDMVVCVDGDSAPFMGLIYDVWPDNCCATFAPTSMKNPRIPLDTCLHIDDMKKDMGPDEPIISGASLDKIGT